MKDLYATLRKDTTRLKKQIIRRKFTYNLYDNITKYLTLHVFLLMSYEYKLTNNSS